MIGSVSACSTPRAGGGGAAAVEAVAAGGDASGAFVRFFVRAGFDRVAAVGVAVADGFEASVERLRDARGTLRERLANVSRTRVAPRHAPRSIRPSAIDTRPQNCTSLPLALGGAARFLWRVTTERSHVPELDGVRGLAALAVIAFHAPTLLDGAHWSTAAARWARGGWLGVDVFFALSGYLITRGLLASRSQPHYFARFYGRRALRILPLYYLYLGGLVLAAPLLPARYYDPAAGDLAYFAALLGNIPDAMGRYPGACLSPLWSLAVEEHWYLLWPLVVWRRTPRALLFGCALFAAVAIGSRALAETYLAPHAAHMLSPCRLDGLATGAAVSLVAHTYGDAPVVAWCRRHALFAAAVLLTVALTPFGPSTFPHVYPSEVFQRLGHSATALAAAVLVGAVGYGAPPTPWLRERALVQVGQVSYGVYLLHAAVGAALTRGVPGITRLPLELGAPLLALATVAVATLVHRLVERPILGLRRYLPSVR